MPPPPYRKRGSFLPDGSEAPKHAPRMAALGVHLLTATGAGLSMLALAALARGDWSGMALWLVLALFVDGIDGPLARHLQVERHAPRLNGTILDLVIDFLTYVVIPVHALFVAGLISGPAGWVAMVGIPTASALYFADTRMKTADKSFLGFPACWNMVAVVIFTLDPPTWATISLLALLTVTMFAPLRFVHPVRTRRWRVVTLPVMLLWGALAGWSATAGFSLPKGAGIALAAASAYLLLAGAVQQARPERSRP